MTQIFAGLFTSRVASLAPPTQPPPPPANNTQLSPLPFHQDDHYSFLPPPFHPRRSNFPEEVLAHTHTHTHTHNPTSNGGMQNGSSVGICYTLHTRFCTFGHRFVCSVGAYRQNFCVGAQKKVYKECVVGWEVKLATTGEKISPRAGDKSLIRRRRKEE